METRDWMSRRARRKFELGGSSKSSSRRPYDRLLVLGYAALVLCWAKKLGGAAHTRGRRD